MSDVKQVIERIEYYVNSYGYDAAKIVAGERSDVDNPGNDFLTIDRIANELGIDLTDSEHKEIVAHF